MPLWLSSGAETSIELVRSRTRKNAYVYSGVTTKPSIALPPVTRGIGENARREIQERLHHPGAEDQHRDKHADELGHERQGRLVHLRNGLDEADDHADDERSREDRGADQQRNRK